MARLLITQPVNDQTAQPLLCKRTKVPLFRTFLFQAVALHPKELIIAAREDQPVIDQKKAREVATEIDSTAEISAGLVGVTLSSGYSDIFSVKSVGSLGESNPTKRIIEAIIMKTKGNNGNKVSIISWNEL